MLLKTFPLQRSLYVLLLCFMVQNLDAQLLDGLSENYWIDASKAKYSKRAAERIGNYSCVSIHSDSEKEKLLEIAAEKSGTLFLVGKLNKSYTGSLLELGGLVVETDAVYCAESKIESSHIGETPFIFKVRYQASPKRKWNDSHVKISDALSVAEIIHYSSQLTSEESHRVESYLALKYSVNITQNNDADLRNYSADEDTDYWLWSADGKYDTEVLALGRVDEWNWNQSQTYSSDASSISISLSNTSTWGDMPSADFADKSVLVVSQKPSEMLENGCYLSSKDFPWKFNFYHWQTTANNLYLSWVTDRKHESALYFTNGEETIELKPHMENGTLSVTIPIGQVALSNKETWFLVWNHQDILCDAIGKLGYTFCNKQSDETNRIEMQLESKALPAAFTLQNVQNGAVLKGQLQSRRYALEHIPSGQYRLLVTHVEGLKLEEVVHFPACHQEKENTGDLSGVELSILPFSEEKNLHKTLGNSIVLYPNPVREGRSFRADFHDNLNGEPFQIEVYDHAGRLMETQEFTPQSGANYYQSLQAEGTYFIHFRSASTVVVQRIVVL